MRFFCNFATDNLILLRLCVSILAYKLILKSTDMEFKITSKYQPTGDQPQAIRQLTEGVEQGDPAQVLLGVTGSGKPSPWPMSLPTWESRPSS